MHIKTSFVLAIVAGHTLAHPITRVVEEAVTARDIIDASPTQSLVTRNFFGSILGGLKQVGSFFLPSGSSSSASTTTTTMTKVIPRDFNDEMEPRDFYDSDGLYAREYDGELMDRDYDSNTKYPEEELKAHEDAAKLNVRDLEEEFKARDYRKFESRKFDGELGARDIFNVDGNLETREHAAVSRRMYSNQMSQKRGELEARNVNYGVSERDQVRVFRHDMKSRLNGRNIDRSDRFVRRGGYDYSAIDELD